MPWPAARNELALRGIAQSLCSALLVCVILVAGPKHGVLAGEEGLRWELSRASRGITWIINQGLPHKDHIAMSGKSVDAIIEWSLDSQSHLGVKRVIRWPMLRTIPDDTHASLSRSFLTEDWTGLMLDGQQAPEPVVHRVRFDGVFRFDATVAGRLAVTRAIFPSVHLPVLLDRVSATNVGKSVLTLHVPGLATEFITDPAAGIFGAYRVVRQAIGAGSFRLAPGESVSWIVSHAAVRKDEPVPFPDGESELAGREAFCRRVFGNLVLESPDPVVNRLFSFSQLRALESIFATRGGLMHGPGGYNKYLAAIWANDQAEYAGPFLPFTGDPAGREAALNAYRHFARYTNDQFKPIPSSIIAEGRSYWNGAGDRGDMAMIAYGAARCVLALGDREKAEELWPLIAWCLEYCRRQVTPAGVVASQSDELEGRFPAGKANLCTAALYYDALISASALGLSLGKTAATCQGYERQAADLRGAIERYFGGEVEGFKTYHYYEGNEVLRAWICIPLTVGIYDRAAATTDALFSPRLWTVDGLATQAGEKTFWDRSTLYALRGVFAAGFSDRAVEKLHAYSSRRLLGDHVPYPIEAWPEQNQSHLAAEGALYARVITEGLLGIRPLGLNECTITPQLPSKWGMVKLRRVHAFGRCWDLSVQRKSGKLQLQVSDQTGQTIYKAAKPPGELHRVSF
jgi:hypothetical protein